MEPIDPAPLSLPPPLHGTYTYDEVAAILKVNVSTLYYRVRRGMIESPVRHGASARFTSEQMARMLAEGTRLPGYYKPTHSVRSKGGKKGGKIAQRNRRRAAAEDTTATAEGE